MMNTSVKANGIDVIVCRNQYNFLNIIFLRLLYYHIQKSSSDSLLFLQTVQRHYFTYSISKHVCYQTDNLSSIICHSPSISDMSNSWPLTTIFVEYQCSLINWFISALLLLQIFV